MRILSLLGLATCLVLGAASAAGARPNGPVAVPPQAGQYNCHMLGAGGMIMTPYGGAPTVMPLPSAIVRVQLDGQGAYAHASGGGRYRYDPASGRLIVESGPFA